MSVAREDFRIALPNFEGPLDLLLHLIREHRIDIFDIPIALITEKYLEMLERMHTIHLDICSEFLLMAATLLQLKSRLLVPAPKADIEEVEGEGAPSGDVREELVRRLLEYQKYKAAAQQLASMPLLGKTVFCRVAQAEKVPLGEGESKFVEVSVYRLIDIFSEALKKLEPKLQHEVIREQLSLSKAIQGLMVQLQEKPSRAFLELLGAARSKSEITILFLGILEMCRLKLIRIQQQVETGDIWIVAREALEEKAAGINLQEANQLEASWT
ncbi:MAG: segregation/condensation protein A [Proteobacteria bacterium]|nr:segregation/condensation protein A [Cystobacterineae bacterium]MCL2258211.1 segregation/condensation protein A [Cystobacterineae bacterium]MCL2315445.1 segregation/condensation protein A [Pseudomonadota bacterium]